MDLIEGANNIGEILKRINGELSDDLMNWKNDFFVQIYEGDMLFPEQRGYSALLKVKKFNDYYIDFEGVRYEINQDIFDKIKKVVLDNLEELIKYSSMQTYQFFMENSYEGGSSLNIHIKYGSLIINLNGNVIGEIKTFCKEFLEKIKLVIIDTN